MLTFALAIVLAAPCTSGKPLRVRFYDVGQGLSALVNLPDGRNVLVDAGSTQPRSYIDKLERDLEHLEGQLHSGRDVSGIKPETIAQTRFHAH